LDGDNVGCIDTDGCCDGNLNGDNVGCIDTDGCCDGVADGCCDTDGDCDGIDDGADDGEDLNPMMPPPHAQHAVFAV